jgi:hypothetical protein
MTIRPTDRPQSIPQWLALFDDPKAPYGAIADADEAPTRFAAYESPEIVPVVPTPTLSTSGAAVVKLKDPPSVDEPGVGEGDAPTEAGRAVADTAARLKPNKKAKAAKSVAEPKKRAWTAPKMALASGAALVVLAGGGWALWPRGGNGGVGETLSSTAGGDDESGVLGPVGGAPPGETGADLNPVNAADAVPGAAVDLGRADTLAAAVAALAGQARAAGRGGDASRLAATSARMRTLAAEAKAAAAQPGSEATVKAKLDQMNALGRAGAAALAQSVRRDAEAKAGQLAQTGGTPEAKSAAAALRSVRASAGAATSAGSAGQAIAAARSTVAASRQFSALLSKAGSSASALPKKRDEFAEIAAAAKSVGAQVVEMGRTKKPGLFASSRRRDDYRVRQANAAAAQAELAKLNDLSQAIGAVTTAAAGDSAIKQAKAISAKLRELQSSSSAAMPTGKDDAAQQNKN